ncbi:hypothetical protein AVEN_210733-1 [Araneus ventricosus]|uniref:Uncharacterized protein n=1 Tax=Araneus ventricosus TaxID=182803 RepID=A0A4Y2SZ28_ARAVE|nr:hypothetical protein AVEN_210733-1 [Araneus ventricosus]
MLSHFKLQITKTKNEDIVFSPFVLNRACCSRVLIQLSSRRKGGDRFRDVTLLLLTCGKVTLQPNWGTQNRPESFSRVQDITRFSLFILETSLPAVKCEKTSPKPARCLE